MSPLERLGARLRPAVLLAFMAAVFLEVSGGRLPVEPLRLAPQGADSTAKPEIRHASGTCAYPRERPGARPARL